MRRVEQRARRALATAVALLASLAACASDGDDGAISAVVERAAPTTESMSPTTATTVAPTTTAASTTAATTTSPPTTAASTTTAAPPSMTSIASTTSTAVAPETEEFVIGESVEGRPITAFRRGTRGGTAVLVIGVIHGDEDAGFEVAEQLRTLPVPDGIDLWVVPSVNPDGQAAQIRHNANGVDLNRNFPEGWSPIAGPGDWQYAGSGPASEPETRAIVALGELVRPDLTLWYHQDLFRINPASGRGGEIRQRYADLTGLPIVPITGGTYTGTASQWSRAVADDGGIGFTVELGPELPHADAARHAAAVLTVASEL